MTDYAKYEVEDFMTDDFFIEWVIGGSVESNQFWEEWLAIHPDRGLIVTKAGQLIRSMAFKPNEEQLSSAEIRSMAEQLGAYAMNGKTRVYSMRPFKRSWLGYAAAIISIFICITLLFTQNKTAVSTSEIVDLTKKNALQQVNNHTALPKYILLADGSSVILKKNSSLTYPLTFAGKNREVKLIGEAFFEVSKDAAHPFYVHSGKMLIKVLGTSFTVIAGKELKVVVNTGRVRVSKDKDQTIGSIRTDSTAVVLVANQLATYQPVKDEFKKQMLSTPLMLSPEIADKEFNFHDAEFSMVIAKLTKAYGVSIVYDAKKMGHCLITASLSKYHFDEKLNYICKALNARYTITDDNIRIDGEGCKEQ
ncbi:FecR family protein [Mucilaginibacter sp.]|jgi:ferric-dicitrate binding protein FerR (iron transport regulator)|uniref:FecR family protein n=1 Tax=Mucilaginibacter sp. TaxID=1882438 RepID=UPI003562B991